MIDWTKPVETDEDKPRSVRVLATDMGGSHPVAVAYIGNPPMLACYTDCGQGWHADISARYLKPLRNVRPKPVKREGWSIVDTDKLIFDSKDEATAYLGNLSPTLRKLNGLVIARIEWEEVPNDA